MPGMSGLELQRRLKSSDAGVPIIFVTAHDDKTIRRQAIEAGAVDFLSKLLRCERLGSCRPDRSDWPRVARQSTPPEQGNSLYSSGRYE